MKNEKEQNESIIETFLFYIFRRENTKKWKNDEEFYRRIVGNGDVLEFFLFNFPFRNYSVFLWHSKYWNGNDSISFMYNYSFKIDAIHVSYEDQNLRLGYAPLGAQTEQRC